MKMLKFFLQFPNPADNRTPCLAAFQLPGVSIQVKLFSVLSLLASNIKPFLHPQDKNYVIFQDILQIFCHYNLPYSSWMHLRCSGKGLESSRTRRGFSSGYHRGNLCISVAQREEKFSPVSWQCFILVCSVQPLLWGFLLLGGKLTHFKLSLHNFKCNFQAIK